MCKFCTYCQSGKEYQNLDKPELDHLNRIVTMYLDNAELQAVRNKPMYMKDWIEKLNVFSSSANTNFLQMPAASVHCFCGS